MEGFGFILLLEFTNYTHSKGERNAGQFLLSEPQSYQQDVENQIQYD